MAEGWEGGRGGWEAQAQRKWQKITKCLQAGPWSTLSFTAARQNTNRKHKRSQARQNTKDPKVSLCSKGVPPKAKKAGWNGWNDMEAGKEAKKQRISRTWLCWSWVRDEIDVRVDWVESTNGSLSKLQKNGQRQNNMLKIKDCQYTFFILK